jgi:hypothetical protein
VFIRSKIRIAGTVVVGELLLTLFILFFSTVHRKLVTSGVGKVGWIGSNG